MEEEGIGLLSGEETERKAEEGKEVQPEKAGGEGGVVLSCDVKKHAVTGGKVSRFSITIKNTEARSDTFKVRLRAISTTALKENAPEWPVAVELGEERYDVFQEEELEIHLKSNEEKVFTVEVHTPHGVKYGDMVEVVVTATSARDMLKTDSITVTTVAKQSVLAVKTSIGHERAVADSIASRAKTRDIGVFSVLSPANLRGYVIVEAMNIDRLGEVVRGIKRARGLVDGETTFDEISHYLEPKPVVAGIAEGDIVELIAGPFKGEKARVQNIDESKEEITVELFEAMVPIPITVRGDSVRVLEKERRG